MPWGSLSGGGGGFSPIAPFAKNVEQIMYYLDQEAARHDWPAFVWQRYNRSAYEPFTPRNAAPFALEGCPWNDVRIWNQIREAWKRSAPFLFQDLSTLDPAGVAWDPVDPADYGAFGKMKLSQAQQLLQALTGAWHPFGPWDGFLSIARFGFAQANHALAHFGNPPDAQAIVNAVAADANASITTNVNFPTFVGGGYSFALNAYPSLPTAAFPWDASGGQLSVVDPGVAGRTVEIDIIPTSNSFTSFGPNQTYLNSYNVRVAFYESFFFAYKWIGGGSLKQCLSFTPNGLGQVPAVASMNAFNTTTTPTVSDSLTLRLCYGTLAGDLSQHWKLETPLRPGANYAPNNTAVASSILARLDSFASLVSYAAASAQIQTPGTVPVQDEVDFLPIAASALGGLFVVGFSHFPNLLTDGPPALQVPRVPRFAGFNGDGSIRLMDPSQCANVFGLFGGNAAVPGSPRLHPLSLVNPLFGTLAGGLQIYDSEDGSFPLGVVGVQLPDYV